ncbi:aldehyde dehydrogenase family protein [Nocardioides aurantiacus]|uniref:aldehyde dehydrogenase family protein n=1 Tax=Nocardioides aurantiacus TaxID=86796 RepID=UPI00403F67E5
MTTLDSPAAATTTEAAEVLVPRLRAAYTSGRTRSLEWRHEQLAALKRMLVEREAEFTAALVEDLGRPPFEAWAADLRASVREIEDLQEHLEAWTAPRKQKVAALFKPAKASVVVEPLGVALVIGPWNYPVQLLACPLAAALAAGNAVVLKPSEVAAATSRAFATWVPQYLDPAAVAVVEGGVPETTALLEQRFDHVFYTGNGTVGRIVAQAAAKHLTPVTLELGGKSPVIVAKDANLKLAASRVAFSRFLNAGQTCVASDHVYVHRDVEQAFLDALAAEIRKRYGSDPRTSADFGRMVNRRHTERVKALLDGGGHDVVVGGEVDLDARYVAPTVVRTSDLDAPLMREEIFGPVLPVLTFDDLTEVCTTIAAGDKPLALYLFTGSDAVVQQMLATTSSGGVCVNDALTHLLVSTLPFGGVGESGYGSYHGRWGIETFSHHKAVYRRPSWHRDLPLLNPPYGRFKQRAARRMF